MTGTPAQIPAREHKAVLPWRVAARWGNPDYGSGKPADLLTRVATFRSVLGMLTLIAANVYTHARPPQEVLTDEGWDKTSLSVAVAVVLVPVFMMGTFVVTRRELRQFR